VSLVIPNWTDISDNQAANWIDIQQSLTISNVDTFAGTGFGESAFAGIGFGTTFIPNTDVWNDVNDSQTDIWQEVETI